MFSVKLKPVGIVALLTLLGGALAGCSETSFKDSFDLGKVSPDESKVQINRQLTIPPDLQLRPPSGAAPQQQVAATVPPVSTQPPQYGAVPQYGTAQPQPQQQAYIPPANVPPAQPVVRRPDVYSRNGISRTRADGTPKTQNELIDELRALKKKQQQATNPNYGTVFNLPKVWSDGG